MITLIAVGVAAYVVGKYVPHKKITLPKKWPWQKEE